MIAPTVTPELAERSLIGASVHAFAVRAQVHSTESEQTDLEFARRIAAPSELAESTTTYAISLVWWAHRDLPSRRALLEHAAELMLAWVADSARDRVYESGFRIYADGLVHAALSPKVHAVEVNVSHFVSGVAEIDLLTARFADSAVSAVLRADCASFGDPANSAEAMRDEMIQLAYLPQAA